MTAAFGLKLTQDLGRLRPERANAFLASFPEGTKVRRWLQAKIRAAERDDLLDPRASVEHARQKRVIAPTTGSGPVERREYGLDLGELQVRNWTRARALEGHGQHPLALLHSVWVLGRTVPKECVDGRKPEFVIGGFKPEGAAFDSLLVGYYDDDGRLRHAGKVRAGFTPTLRRAVHAQIAPLRTARCPFVNLPSTHTSHWGEGVTAEEMTSLTWVRPRIVAEIAFTEWTRDGNLRHASFVALREDRPAQDVHREP